MGRATAKSRPSQSQGPSQTQRSRSGRTRVEEVDEHEDEEEQQDDGGDMSVDEEGDGESDLTRKANDLIRLALFTEHRRGVLRRDEISKKVLAQSPRAFNTVFLLAQQRLRSVFGMELVELPSRAGLDQDGVVDEQLDEARNATGVKKKAAAAGSKTYILRSTLDPTLIEHAAQTDGTILEEEAGDQGLLFPLQSLSDDDDTADEGERNPKFYGSIISWSRADQLGTVGILYVILSLILVSGRVIPDMDLRRQLNTLHLTSNDKSLPIHYNTASTTRSSNLDTYLMTLLKQNYLDRQQVGGENAAKGKKGAGVKRLRTQAQDLEEGKSYEWRWGPRAHCEVGEEAIAKFIAEFMVGFDADDEDGAAGAQQQEAMLKKMLEGITKAAGGKLQELK